MLGRRRFPHAIGQGARARHRAGQSLLQHRGQGQLCMTRWQCRGSGRGREGSSGRRRSGCRRSNDIGSSTARRYNSNTSAERNHGCDTGADTATGSSQGGTISADDFHCAAAAGGEQGGRALWATVQVHCLVDLCLARFINDTMFARCERRCLLCEIES